MSSTDNRYKVVGVAQSDPEGLVIRERPDRTSAKRGSIPYNADNVVVTGEERSGWLPVTYNTISGYSNKTYLVKYTPAAAPSETPVARQPVAGTAPALSAGGVPPYYDYRYRGDAPPSVSAEKRLELSRITDRMSGPWYNNRSGNPDTIVFHTDVASESDPKSLIPLFNGNWLVPTANFPIKKSYHIQILRQPYEGKGTNLFVPFEYDAWHARAWSAQSIGIAFNNDFKPNLHELTDFQLQTATQWVSYLCKRFPTIKYVTRHGQVDPQRRSDPNQLNSSGRIIEGATNFDLQYFINVCSQATGQPVSDCPVGSDCRERRREVGSRVPGAQNEPYISYPQREVNQAAKAQIDAIRIDSSSRAADFKVFTGVADLMSFHPNVQYELTRRRLSQNTIHSHMPFVKLTSIMSVAGSNLSTGTGAAWCPSIGVHGEMQTKFEDVYAPTSNRNLVGYAVTCNDDGTDKVGCFSTPVLVDEINAQIDPVVVPPPGITSITTDRNLAGGFAVRGGLFRATLKIQAFSVGQVNTLIKYFLRPSTNLVLEMGRLSSQEMSSDDIIPEFPTDGVVSFPWYRPKDQVKQELLSAIALPEDRSRFVQKYVYNNFGKYEIFICYVANFKMKYNNGVYEIELQIHSVQQMELATKHTGARATCTNSIANRCKAIDVHEYFSDKYAWKENTFSALLAQAADSKTQLGKSWSNHVAQIRRTQPDSQNLGAPDAAGAPAGLGEGYYMSWRFFIEKVLHDRKYGILSVFQGDEVRPENRTNQEGEGGAAGDDELSYPLLHSALISPIPGARTGAAVPADLVSRGVQINTTAQQLIAHEVGYHPALRSVDPATMLIYNPRAQQQYNAALVNNISSALATLNGGESPLSTNDELTNFIEKGEVPPFENSTGQNDKPGTTFLTNGVWLNTNMVKQAFAGTDSVNTALTHILRNMNNATEGYWNLQLVSNDVHSGQTPGIHVVDAQAKFGNLSAAAVAAASGPGVLPKLSSEYTQRQVGTYGIFDIYRNDEGEIKLSTGDNYTLGPSKEKVRELNVQNGFVYMFNRRYRQLIGADDGPELLNLNIDYDLPTAVFVQAVIGAGGLAERGILQVLDTEEINNLSLIKTQLQCPPADGAQGDATKLPPCRYDLPTEYRTSPGSSAAAPSGTPNSPSATPVTYKVTGVVGTDTLNIRSASNATATVVAQIPPNGTGITVTGAANGQFVPIRWTSYSGWVNQRYITPETPVSAPATPAAASPSGAAAAPGAPAGADGGAAGEPTPEQITAAEQVVSRNQNYVNLIREYGHIGTAINMIEFNPAEMLKQLDTATDPVNDRLTAGRTLSRNNVHPFNSSNLTKTQVELTIPGIAGIQLWQTFLLDRVPTIVRNGAYVVTKIAHDFSVDKGWTTKITGKFRYLNKAELVNLGFNQTEINAGLADRRELRTVDQLNAFAGSA